MSIFQNKFDKPLSVDEVKEAMKSGPIVLDKINRSKLDYRTGIPLSEQGRRELGMENDTESFGNVFKENLISSSRNIASSLLTTFGATDMAALIDAKTEANLDYDRKRLLFDSFSGFLGSASSWSAQSLGMVIPDVGGAIVSGVATQAVGVPAILGSTAFSFARMQGSNYRMIRDWRPDYSTDQAWSIAVSLSALQAAFEQIGGMESMAAQKILGKKTIIDLAEDMASSASGKAVATPLGKIILSSKNKASAFAKGAAAEMFDEQLEGGAEVLYGIAFGDQKYTAEKLFEKLVEEPAMALLPGGILGSSFVSANAVGKAAGALPVVTKKDEVKIFSIEDGNGKFAVDTKAKMESDAAFAQLEVELKPLFKKSTRGAVDQIKSMAYLLSYSAQLNYNEPILPQHFIETLKVAIVDGKLDPKDIDLINQIRGDANLSPEKKQSDIMDYIGARYGKESGVYKAYASIGEMVEASEIARYSDEIRKTIERHVPRLDNDGSKALEERLNSFVKSIVKRVARGTLGGQERLKYVTELNPVSYNELGDRLSRDDIASIFYHEPIVDVDGVKYKVVADDVGISFVPALESERMFSEIVDEYQNLIIETRRDTSSLDGSRRIAMEKAMHALLERKINISEILAAYDHRDGSVPVAFSGELGRSVEMELNQARINSEARLAAGNEKAKRMAAEAAKTFTKRRTNLVDRLASLVGIKRMRKSAVAGAQFASEYRERLATLNLGIAMADGAIDFKKDVSAVLKAIKVLDGGSTGTIAETVTNESTQKQAMDGAKDLGIKYNDAFKDEAGNVMFHDFHAPQTHGNFSINEGENLKSALIRHLKAFDGDRQLSPEQQTMVTESLSRLLADEQKIATDDEMLAAIEMAEFALARIDANIGNIQEMKAGIESALPYNSASEGLFDQRPTSTPAMYIPAYRTAFFFKNADVVSVLHEFAHHARSILPTAMQSDLLDIFNEATGSNAATWTVDSEEWFAKMLSTWVVIGKPPINIDGERRKVFQTAISIIKQAYPGFDLSEQTKADLDRMFAAAPNELLPFGAYEVMRSMVFIEPPTHEMLSRLIVSRFGSRFGGKANGDYSASTNPLEGALFDTRNEDVELIISHEERVAINNQMHAKATHEQITEFARKMFGNPELRIDQLNAEDFISLAKAIDTMKMVKDDDIAANAVKESRKLLEHTMATEEKKGSQRIVANSGNISRIKQLVSRRIGEIKTLSMNMLSFNSIMKVLDGYKDSGIWHNILYEPIRAARKVASGAHWDHAESLTKRIVKSGVDMEKLQAQRIPVNGFEYTKGEVMFMAMVARSRKSDIESFIASNHQEDTEAGMALLKECNRIVSSDSEMTSFVNVIHDTFKELHGPLSKVYKDATGNELGQIDWYIPFIRTNQWDDMDDVLSKLNSVDKKGFEHYRSATSRMKKRLGGGNGIIDMSDPFGKMIRYMNQATTYMGKAMAVKQVSAVLNSKDTMDALRWKFGMGIDGESVYYLNVHKILSDLVMGELFHDARIKPMSASEVRLRNMRSRFTMFALAGNVSTSIKQILSLPLGIARSGKMAPVALRCCANLLSMSGRAMSNSLHNVIKFAGGRARRSDYIHILAGTPVYENWARFSPELLSRHGNPETGEVMTSNLGGFMGIRFSGYPLGEALMAGIQAIDAITVGSLWQATFDSWTAEYMKSMTEEQAMFEAAKMADAMITDTQPPTLPHERNLLQRGNEWVRGMFMFSGSPMRNAEVFMTDILGRTSKALSEIKTSGYASLYDALFRGDGLQSGIVQQLGVGYILPAVMLGMISRRRKQEDEQELIFDILSYPFAALPFSRGMIGLAVGLETYDGGDVGTYYESFAKEVYSGIKATAKAYHGEGWTGKNIDEAMDAISIMISVPRTTGRIASKAWNSAVNGDGFLDQLKGEYIDPYKPSQEL